MDWLIGSAIATLVVLAPRIGVLAWLGRRRLSRRREDEENALKHLLHQQYEGQQGSFASLAGALRLTDRSLMSLMQRLEERGLVERRGQAFALTVDGERLAVHVVRAHRLLERYLADEARLPLERLHAEAERREHALSPEDVDRLDASLGYPATDPHGDPIPTREGAVRGHGGKALTDWTPGTAGRIVHLEDEPTLAYSQIVAEGLRVGQIVRLLGASPARLVLSDGENEYRLAPLVAGNVFLAAVDEARTGADGVLPLSETPRDLAVEIVAFDDACRGYTRRRLLDLGFTPGTRIVAALDTFSGDPRAYRVRGTTVALRREQAAQILVRAVA